MLPSRFRLIPVLLVVSLIVLGSGSAVIRKAHAVPWIDLRSRENNNATTNKGTITLWSTTYSLPNGREALTTDFQIAYTPAPGYKFVKWEGEGGVTFDNANSQTTQAHISDVGEYTIRAVYEAGSSVGGILLPTNPFAVLAPYLAMIGLIATAGIAYRRKRVYSFVRRPDVRLVSRRRVDGLSVKPGPTQSGAEPVRVGGVILPPVNYLLVGLLLLLVLSMAVLFYRKRDAVLRVFAPFLTRFRIF